MKKYIVSLLFVFSLSQYFPLTCSANDPSFEAGHAIGNAIGNAMGEASYNDRPNANLVEIANEVLRDKNYTPIVSKENLTIYVNTKYIHLDGTKKKPKIDAYSLWIITNPKTKEPVYLLSRDRNYYNYQPNQTKLLFSFLYDKNLNLVSYLKEGSKEKIVKGSIADIQQKFIYDYCSKLNTFNKLS